MAELVQFKNSFGHALYGIPVAVQMPPRNKEVILFVEDANVAIHGKPVIGWNSGTDAAPTWWAGLPASYISLAEKRWTVTHWRPLHADRPDGVPAADEAQERAAFEAAMRPLHPEWAFTADPVFDYHNERTRCAWEGWKAARGVAAAAPAELAATFRRAWEGPRGGPTDQQIKDRCAAAGIRWIEPDDEPDGFPGSFDMVTMAEMRALLTADGSGVLVGDGQTKAPAGTDGGEP